MDQYGNVDIAKQSKHAIGYMIASIAGEDRLVHQLMGEAFLKEKPNEWDDTWTIDHKDNDPTNNVLSNLSWKSKQDQRKNRRKVEQTLIYSCPVIGVALSDIILIDGEIVMKGEDKRFDNASIAANAIVGGDQSRISMCIRGKDNDHAGFSWKTPINDPNLPGEMFMIIDRTKSYERFVSAHGRVKYKYHHGYEMIKTAEQMMTKRTKSETNTYPRLVIDRKNTQFHRTIVKFFIGELPETIDIDGCERRLVVDHVDDVKTNARLGNLQLLTQNENMKKRHLASYTTSVASFVKEKYEKSHATRVAAIEFVKNNGYSEATLEELNTSIDLMIAENIPATLYGRTWIRAHFESIVEINP
jgi:hypothetical protein